MELADLKSDVMQVLAPSARKVMEDLVSEYGASETFGFLLALVAGSTQRERQLIRLFLRRLEEVAAEEDSGKA